MRERERQRERETRAEMREVSEFGREGDGNIVGKEMAVRGDKVKGEDEKWWRDVTVNSAYAPMTVHWSLEEGLLGETWIGALGLLAGLVGFRQAWKETA